MRILGYIALIAWLVLGWKYLTDFNQCNPSKAVPANLADTECPVCFDWYSPNANTCDNWIPYRDSLVSLINTDNQLLITGLFNPIESSDEELGRNRAVSIKALFNGLIPEENIEIDVEEVGVKEYSTCKKMARLDVLVDGKVQHQNTLHTAMLFLQGNKLSRSDSTYHHLEQVAEHVIDSGEKVRITGYTDTNGNSKDNIKRGYQYADQVKAFLIDKGVSLEQLITISKGENEQINQQSNNRVAVVISKS